MMNILWNFLNNILVTIEKKNTTASNSSIFYSYVWPFHFNRVLKIETKIFKVLDITFERYLYGKLFVKWSSILSQYYLSSSGEEGRIYDEVDGTEYINNYFLIWCLALHKCRFSDCFYLVVLLKIF